ncbi:MAG: acyloxyacyl hydrolase [Chthoniobacterales bacterium]
MKGRRFFLAFLVFASLLPCARAGSEAVSPHLRDPGQLDAPSFEMAAETSYLWGSLANPNSYEVGAQFITARWRLGTIDRPGWMRGYNQIYALAMAEPILRGPENFYYGISVGLRYNFVQPGSRWQPYISGGVGLGWIDSHSDIYGAQGQDFTFNILSAVGVSYKVNDHVKISVGALYEHLSNAGQTDPNPSLNLFGPQIGLTYSF